MCSLRVTLRGSGGRRRYGTPSPTATAPSRAWVLAVGGFAGVQLLALLAVRSCTSRELAVCSRFSFAEVKRGMRVNGFGTDAVRGRHSGSDFDGQRSEL